jgi:hypothetical protein
MKVQKNVFEITFQVNHIGGVIVQKYGRLWVQALIGSNQRL